MNWEAVIGVCSILAILVEIVLGVWFYLGQRRADRSDAQAKRRDERIDELEKTITEKAEAVIEAKFELVVAKFETAIAPFNAIVDTFKQRLERGDAAFSDIADVQRTLEVGAEKREGQMRTWIVSTFGTRAEINQLAGDLANLQQNMAAFHAECRTRHHVGTMNRNGG